jgi:LysM repeat protein
MSKQFMITLLFLLYSFGVKAQNDSLFISIKGGKASVVHLVQKEENLYTIAQQYNVPALVLSQSNDVSFYERLEPKRKLLIPLGIYNYVKTKPTKAHTAKSLYYQVLPTDHYYSLAAALGTSEDFLKSLNNNLGPHQLPNSILLAGWVLYQAPDAPAQNEGTANSIAKVASVTTALIKKDTLKLPPSELEKQFNYQTSNGQFVDSANGMVVFFKPQTAIDNKLLFAFSNEFAKGRVLKVVNPSNGKFVFAKVIGALPSTKQYLNAKIGLDGRARAELETREIKLWCDFFMKY